MPAASTLPPPLRRLQGLRLDEPFRLWNSAHLSRRAGVLLVLSPSRQPTYSGELEALLTVRSQQLSYAGDAALPGGKADTLNESPWDVAVREAEEEIGLSASQFEFVKTMPAYVSSRMLMVVPSVAWAPRPISSHIASASEVDKVFSAPLRRFLSSDRTSDAVTEDGTLKLHHFDLLATRKQIGQSKYDRVWGLTANILIDCAKLCYNESPAFDFYRGKKKAVGTETPAGNMDVLRSMLQKGTLQTAVKRHTTTS